jgi:hypothetical protein
MLVLTGRQWLDVGDWKATDTDARQDLVARIGADKTDEFIATMDRIAVNLLYTLDTLKMSEATMHRFIEFATAVALDNTLQQERGTGFALGYRAEMFELSDGQGHGGAVATGSGFGSDFIVMDWTDAKGQRHAGVVRGLDLLRAWVATFAPEEAKDFPKGLAPPPGG